MKQLLYVALILAASLAVAEHYYNTRTSAPGPGAKMQPYRRENHTNPDQMDQTYILSTKEAYHLVDPCTLKP